MATASPQRLRLQVAIALDNGQGQVTDLRKFLHITRPDETISTLTAEVDEKFKKLYPAERVQDDSGCDLDPAFQLLDVFEERGVARVIISDDGNGVRRFHSPASQVRHLQRNDHPRRESFDSVTGYVTPSVSSFNTASPIQNRLAVHHPVTLTIGESTTPLTEDALEKMEIEQKSRSPELPSPSPMPPNERKRKRSIELEIPGTPQAKGTRPGKKRVTGKSVGVPEITDSQDTKILETPEIERKRRASPAKEVDPPKKPRNTRARKSDLSDKQVEEENTAEKDDDVVTEKVDGPKVVITKRPMTRKQTTKQLAAVKGQPRSEVVSPPAVPAPDLDPETTTKTRRRAKDNVNASATNSTPSLKPVVEVSTAAKNSPKSTKEKDVSKPNTPPKANPWSAEPKPKAKQPAKRTTAKANNATPAPEPESVSKTVSARKRAAKSKNPEVSSTTSDFPSSKGSVEEESGTSLTSRSRSETSSSSESEDESDGDSVKGKTESASRSDEEDSGSDSSSDESDSEEKMDVDSVKEKSVSARSSPAVSKGRSLSHLKKGKGASKSTSKVPEAEDKDVSRSPSPTASASSSSSKSDKSSDSDSSDSEDSASDDASVDNGSESENPAPDSDSESSDSDSSSSSSSSASSSSSKRRSASPAASASSTKSSAKDSNSSSSSLLVAHSLGGQTSAQKSQPVDPILHRAYLSQTTDRSPNSTTLSQQSPLAKHGPTMLKRWTSLTDMAASMKKKPIQTVIAKAKRKEEDASEESGSDSDSSEDSSSDDEKKDAGNGIPKAKLAGRAPVAKKKSGGLRAMFK